MNVTDKEVKFYNLVNLSMDAELLNNKSWMVKLSRFGASPVQRVPDMLANSMRIPVLAAVSIPNNDEYILCAILDKEASTFYRNTYYCTISIISTAVKDSEGNCLMLMEDLPTDTYLMLLKKDGEFMRLALAKPVEFRIKTLNELGLLIVTTPQPIEQASKYLVN